MGKNSSKITIQDYISSFQVVYKDEVRNITYLKEKRTAKQFILKQIFVNDKQSIQYIQNQFQRRKSFSHQHITQLRQYYVSSSDQFCSTLYHCSVLYQFPFRTIQQQRNNRLKSAVCFDNDQLLSILASLVLGFSYFQKNYVQHQSIRSSNIYVDLTGTIKISDPYAKQLQTNYELYLHSVRSPLLDGVYLSPNQLKSLKDQQKYPVHNAYKSDVFCLGIVLLQLANLRIPDQIFNLNKGTINENILNEQIELFGIKYGQQIKKILLMMLCINESQRLDWNQLEIFVKKQERKKTKRESLYENDFKHIKNSQSPQNSTIINNQNLKTQNYQIINNIQTRISSPNIKQIRVSPNNIKYEQVGTFQNKNYMSTQNLQLKLKKVNPQILNERRYLKSPDHYQNKNLSNAHINPSQNNYYLLNNKVTFTTQNNTKPTLPFKEPKPFIPPHPQSPKYMQPMEISQKDTQLLPINLIFKYQVKTNIDENFIEIDNSNDQEFTSSEEEYNNVQVHHHNKNIIKQQPQSSKVSIMIVKQQSPIRKSQTSQTNEQRTKRISSIEQKKIQKTPINNSKPSFVKQLYIKEEGVRYQGEKLRGMRHGRGKFYYKEGGMYQGQWYYNKMHGYGKLYYTNGKLAYEGHWEDDYFNGYGKFYNSKPQITAEKINYKNFDQIGDKWKVYEGEFLNQKRHGNGVLTFQNGQRYEGRFVNDKIDGQGVFKSKSGIITGKWVQNKFLQPTQ